MNRSRKHNQDLPHRPVSALTTPPPESLLQIREILRLLTPREELVLKMRFGIGKGEEHTLEEVARSFNVTASVIREIERKALRKVRDATTSAARNARMLADEATERRYQILLKEAIESVDILTPELVQHLCQHHEKIEQIPPSVLEQLVAEVFASWGWDEVRLVGRSSETSADILAGYRMPHMGSRVRFFVEVKRLRSRVGIEVIEQVLGAMVAERPRLGWHAALIVATGGFKAFRNYTPEDLSLKGIELRAKEDLVKWLSDYKPSAQGLWLPNVLGPAGGDAPLPSTLQKGRKPTIGRSQSSE